MSTGKPAATAFVTREPRCLPLVLVRAAKKAALLRRLLPMLMAPPSLCACCGHGLAVAEDEQRTCVMPQRMCVRELWLLDAIFDERGPARGVAMLTAMPEYASRFRQCLAQLILKDVNNFEDICHRRPKLRRALPQVAAGHLDGKHRTTLQAIIAEFVPRSTILTSGPNVGLQIAELP